MTNRGLKHNTIFIFSMSSQFRNVEFFCYKYIDKYFAITPGFVAVVGSVSKPEHKRFGSNYKIETAIVS